MRRHISPLGIVTAGALALGLAAFAACSGSVDEQESSTSGTTSGAGGQGGAATTSSTSSTTATTTTGTSGDGGGAPQPMCVDAKGPVFAVSELFAGDTNPDGTKAADAWMQYGFDIDGLTSTKDSTDLCQPIAGGTPSKAYPDGNDGIDNSFGKNVVPLIAGFAGSPTDQVNAAIANGDFTLLTEVEGLGPDADAADLTAKLLSGGSLGSAPKFDGSDCWPVAAESLSNPADIESATALFPMSTLAANHLETAAAGTTVTVTLLFSGIPFTLTVHEARIAMDLDAAHGGATHGQLGGVLVTEELVAAVKQAVGTFNASLCSGATFDSIANQIRYASDILSDGTQDPQKTCDAISIGIGFNAKSVRFGGVAPASPPPPDPCAQ